MIGRRWRNIVSPRTTRTGRTVWPRCTCGATVGDTWWPPPLGVHVYYRRVTRTEYYTRWRLPVCVCGRVMDAAGHQVLLHRWPVPERINDRADHLVSCDSLFGHSVYPTFTCHCAVFRWPEYIFMVVACNLSDSVRWPTTSWPSWASITRPSIRKCPTACRTACAESRYSSDHTFKTSDITTIRDERVTPRPRPDVRHRQLVRGTAFSSVETRTTTHRVQAAADERRYIEDAAVGSQTEWPADGCDLGTRTHRHIPSSSPNHFAHRSTIPTRRAGTMPDRCQLTPVPEWQKSELFDDKTVLLVLHSGTTRSPSGRARARRAPRWEIVDHRLRAYVLRADHGQRQPRRTAPVNRTAFSFYLKFSISECYYHAFRYYY